MSVYATLNGKYIGVEPGRWEVYANRPAGGPWEELTITKHERWSDVLAIAANRQICVSESTRQMETRPAGEIDGWGGQWDISADGKTATCDKWSLALEGYHVAKPLHLEQRGNDFVDAAGQRMVYAGCDMFLAYRQYLDGGAAALVPFVQESNALGFTVWRIWSQGSKKQNQVFDLRPTEAGYYDHVRSFAETLNANGIIPLMTCYVDNQDVKSDGGHWTALADRVRGTATLLSGGNQFSKNGFDPYALPDPGGFIWSRGSDVEDTITKQRGATSSELHATRTSFDRALMDATASPPFMRKPENQGGGGATMCWMTEGAPFDTGSEPREAWALGRGYSILWSLAVFHNRQSQRGQLMTDGTARCGAAWVKGMTL